MKKLLALLAVLALMLPTMSALAEEGGIVVISSPDMAEPEFTGSLDNMILGQGIDLGDRVYLPSNG